METRHPVENYFGSEFRAICNRCGFIAAWSGKTLTFFQKCLRFGGKMTPYGKIFKILFRKFLSRHRLTCCHCCIHILWNLAHGKSVKSCVIYLTTNTKFRLALQLSLLPRSRPKSASASRRQCRSTQSSRFHPYRFTLVIAKRVNTAKTRRQVNAIFGWSLASSWIISSWYQPMT